jgi:hypothetical protein
VPKSHSRKKPSTSLPRRDRAQASGPGFIKRMAAPLMVTCWLAGLAWVVLYYVIPDLGVFGELGGWNLLIGMGVIGIGFVFATQWE